MDYDLYFFDLENKTHEALEFSSHRRWSSKSVTLVSSTNCSPCVQHGSIKIGYENRILNLRPSDYESYLVILQCFTIAYIFLAW